MNSPSEGEAAARIRARQQEVVAELGQQALETDDLDALMHDASVAVAETLDNDYAKVLELLPGGDEVFLRRGVGWSEGLVGSARVPTDLDSQAGYTLLSEEPVIVEDLRTEERFSGPELLTNHDVVSGISVVIGSVEEPWGVLGTHATARREFTQDDAVFVQNVANVLAAAIDRAEREAELERHKEYTDDILAAVDDMFYVVDEGGNFRRWNESLTTVTGYSDSEVASMQPLEFVAEADRESIANGIAEIFETGSGRVEAAVLTKDGEEIPYEFVASRLENPEGESVLAGIGRDITERKERERELELFRTLLDHSTDSVTVIDPETARYLDVNDTGCRMRGYSREELLQLAVFDVETQVADLDAWRSIVEELKAVGDVTFDGEHERKDGATYPVEVNASYVELDRAYIIAITRDVTERRVRERRLEESERRYRTLAENFPNGAVGVYDHDLRYTLTEGVVLGDTLPGADRLEGSRVPDVFPDETVADLEPVFRAAIEDGVTDSTTTEFDGRNWRVWATPLHDADGEIVAGLSFCQDITEQVERNRQLEESNERLEQFAYAASHDLREPLRMISSYLQLVERRYADDLDSEGREFIDFAVDGADRMREMIDGLLDYSRVETQGDPFEPTDLDTVLAEVLADLQLQIEETDAEITAETLPRVEGDASQLRQLFQNLLENAIEYSGDEPPSIHTTAERNGQVWTVSVRDEGIGIDPADRERIFEVFQRLHSHEEHEGTGIGLALCKRIVERHGGEIWVDSAPGEGATFRFTLPVTDT